MWCSVFDGTASYITYHMFFSLRINYVLPRVIRLPCCHGNNRPQPGGEIFSSHQRKACGNMGYWSRCWVRADRVVPSLPSVVPPLWAQHAARISNRNRSSMQTQHSWVTLHSTANSVVTSRGEMWWCLSWRSPIAIKFKLLCLKAGDPGRSSLVFPWFSAKPPDPLLLGYLNRSNSHGECVLQCATFPHT